MGSYYEATIQREDGTPKRYCTHDVDNGLKLMEHSYIGNEYVDRIMSMLIGEPGRLSWVCDYSDEHIWCWDKTDEASKEEFLEDSMRIEPTYFILNHDEKQFIDIEKLEKIERKESEDWPINPITLLTNSSDSSLGGGDYHPEWSQRKSWDMHEIEVVLKEEDLPQDYRDITEDVAVYESEN